MKDWGRTSRVGTSFTRPSPTRAPDCVLRAGSIPQRSARRSTTTKPALCRVLAYLRPGLPRPTTIRTGSALGRRGRGGQLFALALHLGHREVLAIDEAGAGRRGELADLERLAD